MLSREETLKRIEERMDNLETSDMCALFLLSTDQKDTDDEETDHAPEQTESLLSRFFRTAEDIIGEIGEGRYAAFLCGRLTEKVIWEKARTLSEAMRFSEDHTVRKWGAQSFVGVYMFHGGESSFSHAFREAGYALEMARQNTSQHFYVYPDSGLEGTEFSPSGNIVTSRMLQNYIDEGVRLLKAGVQIQVVYASPGFYGRLGIQEEEADRMPVRIHPEDQEAYEMAVREAAESGVPRKSRYRVEAKDGQWIFCRIRLLAISSENGVPIVLEISHNITGLEQLKNQNDENKEWLRYVAGQTDFQLWETDVKNSSFRLLYTRGMLEGRQDYYENFPESLIDCGRVHPESADAFRKFARGIYEGKPEGSGNFMIQYRQTSCYGWVSMSYHMLYDRDGHPQKAIGIKEDLSYRPGRHSGVTQRRPMPSDLYPYLYCFLQADLTEDLMEKLFLEGREKLGFIRCRTYTETMEKGCRHLFSSMDADRLEQLFSRRNMLERYEQGQRWFCERCRVVNSKGEIHWILMGVNLWRDLESGNVCLFAYMSDEGMRRQWVNDLHMAPLTDPVSGICEPATARALIRHVLAHETKNDVCALVRIRIAGADELFPEGNGKIRDIYTALHVFIGTDCVAGRTEANGDFLVFLPHAGSRTLLRRKLENVFSFVRMSLDGVEEMKYLRLVACVVTEEGDRADITEMSKTARKFCSLHTGEAADVILFSGRLEKYIWNDVELDMEDMEEPESQTLPIGGAMTEEEKDVSLACMELMLRAETRDDSVNGVLHRLGEYYQADRVYVLILTEGRRVITMLNEWFANGKYSIQQSISGKQVEHFPVLARFANNPEPLFLSMKEPSERTGGAVGKISWQYVVCPMGEGEDSLQMLCIENPRKKVEGTSLLQQLLPFLGRERLRFGAQKKASSPLEKLYSLPNMKNYMDTIYSMDSDVNSSLGVMVVDIPEFEYLKEQRGYEYGTQFLVQLSNALTEVFGKSLLFHTHEAEFVVLCRDITYEPFLNLCARARQLVGRKYARKFRIGCTWSDGVFVARDLVQKAHSLLRCINISETEMAWQNADDGYRHLARSLKKNGQPEEGKSKGNFVMYLQPKIDMQTGELAGAEALVRIFDEKGAALPHVRIIEEMEKDGTIPDLDYFIFDQAMSTLGRWRKKDYPLIPISSNFSRHTLLNPSCLASTLAILSRYPEVSHELVEIEITETAGDFENSTFADLIQRFGEYGIQFSLDDFGSRYSNLSMLTNLHFHSVKLDRSIIRNITENSVSRILVKDIAHLCEECDIVCVVEGVETEKQAETLMDVGCRYAQGYYYDRPMPLYDFEKKYFSAHTNKEERI